MGAKKTSKKSAARPGSHSRGDNFTISLRMPGARVKNGDTIVARTGSGKSQMLIRVADTFGVDVQVLKEALRQTPGTQADNLKRVSRVATGLEKELGGQAMLRKWAHSKVRALDDQRPVDVLAKGKVDALERVQKVLKRGVFS